MHCSTITGCHRKTAACNVTNPSMSYNYCFTVLNCTYTMLFCMPLTNKVSSSSSSSCDISSERDWSERHICPSRHERCFHQTAQVGTLVSSGKTEAVITVGIHSALQMGIHQPLELGYPPPFEKTTSISSPPSARPGE